MIEEAFEVDASYSPARTADLEDLFVIAMRGTHQQMVAFLQLCALEFTNSQVRQGEN